MARSSRSVSSHPMDRTADFHLEARYSGRLMKQPRPFKLIKSSSGDICGHFATITAAREAMKDRQKTLESLRRGEFHV